MTDPAAQDGLARALAYAHPLWMLASIALAALALRSGLALRSARRRGLRRRPDALRRHLSLAKPAIVLVAIGFVGGPLSMAFLRGREPFGTAHGWIGATALLLFVAAAVLGRRLEHGRGRPLDAQRAQLDAQRAQLDAHAALATLAVLAAGAAALTGFVLLP